MLCGDVVNSVVSSLSWSKLLVFLFVGEGMPALQGSVKGTDLRTVSFPFLRSLVGRLGGWPKGCTLFIDGSGKLTLESGKFITELRLR